MLRMPTSRSRFQNVLCGIDFSQDSRAALQYAGAVAHRAGGRVVALFVNDELLEQAARIVLPKADLAARTMRELEKFVASALGPDATLVAPEVTSGKPADEIQKAAGRVNADLIVL